MMKAMRKIDITLLCFAVVILVAAIFYRTGGIRPLRTSVVLSGWLEDEAGGTLREIIAEYERDNPGIKIVLKKKNREQVRADCAAYLASLAGGVFR
jgi:ABC-type glycerol-3-phosphate transport system substrate-binding protein